MLTAASLIATHIKRWDCAVDHKFLDECESGAIARWRFDRWVAQDYLFVLDFVRFSATVLAKAPQQHFDVLIDGLTALKAEVHWFQDLAGRLRVSLEQEMQPTCQRYAQFMTNATAQPYPVHLTCLWAIERCYNEAWRGHQAAEEPYAECTARWGSPEFSSWVARLERCVDEALAGATEREQEEAEALFLKICELEGAFWDMAYDGR